MSLWTLDEALELVRSLHLPLADIGWCCGIGGGVLIKGSSDKDLDLIFVPYCKTNHDIGVLNALLSSLDGWERYCTVDVMHAHWRSKGLEDTKHVEAWTFKGKRVDVISPATDVS